MNAIAVYTTALEMDDKHDAAAYGWIKLTCERRQTKAENEIAKVIAATRQRRGQEDSSANWIRDEFINHSVTEAQREIRPDLLCVLCDSVLDLINMTLSHSKNHPKYLRRQGSAAGVEGTFMWFMEEWASWRRP